MCNETKRKLRHYMFPNIFAMLGISCYVLADTYFISVAEGADGIAALNLAIPVYSLLFALGSMVGIGSATRYSIRKAMGEEDADQYFSNSIMWGSVAGLVFFMAGLCFPDKILQMLGADQSLLKIGTSYLRTAMLFSPFFILNYTFTAFARNDHSPKIAMAATVGSSLFNIVFDYIFMFPLKMGMNGAALATGIAPVVSICICMLHYLSKRNTIIFYTMMPSVSKLMDSCSLGIVALVGELSGGITTMVFNYILLGLSGNVAVAAYGIITNIALVATSIFNGIVQGLQPMASEAHGKGDHAVKQSILQYCMRLTIVIAIGLVVIVRMKAEAFVEIFNSEHSVKMASYAVKGLGIYFTGFLIAGVNIVLSGFLSATGRAAESSRIALFRGVVGITIFALMLSKVFGILGVWMAFPVVELITLGMYLLFHTGKSHKVDK